MNPHQKRRKLLAQSSHSNVLGYRITRYNKGKLEEKVFAETLGGTLFESDWREVKDCFKARFRVCEHIPSEAEFIGYYSL